MQMRSWNRTSDVVFTHFLFLKMIMNNRQSMAKRMPALARMVQVINRIWLICLNVWNGVPSRGMPPGGGVGTLVMQQTGISDGASIGVAYIQEGFQVCKACQIRGSGGMPLPPPTKKFCNLNSSWWLLRCLVTHFNNQVSFDRLGMYHNKRM